MQKDNLEVIFRVIITLILLFQLIFTFYIYTQMIETHGILQSWDVTLMEE